MKFIFLILIIAGGIYYYQFQRSPIHIDSTKLHPTVLKLKKDIDSRKISKEDVRQLNNAFYKSASAEAKEYTVRLLALSLLAVSPDAFPKFKQKINRDYPDEDYLSFLDDEFPNNCTSCDGQGAEKCPKCKGTAKCANRKCNQGRIKYEGVDQAVDKQCPVCRGKDECSSCTGSGLSYQPCKKCSGSGFQNVRRQAEELYRQSIRSL